MGVMGISTSETMFQSSPAHESGCANWLKGWKAREDRFQSSPAHESGCAPAATLDAVYDTLFQSSPAHESGCAALRGVLHRACHVRFNPHPPMRAGAPPRRGKNEPEGQRFNPHPPMRAGAPASAPGPSSAGEWFQSSPAHESGCALVACNAVVPFPYVSILTRP